MQPGISVVIPVYNSEASLKDLVARLSEALPKVHPDHEVILVNDGSRDGSWQAICEAASRYPWIRGINLMRNYGQHNALLCGIRSACKEIIVTMDDDLQHPPEEIPKLLDRLEEGYDVVYGAPRSEQHGLWRNLASQATKVALQNAMGVENARHVSAFRAFHTNLRDAFARYGSPFVSIDVLLTWASNRFSVVFVQHDPRVHGPSTYTVRRLMQHAVNMITGFSVLPLQLASLMGFGFAIFGFIVLIYVIGRYLIQGGSVPGFPFLASTIAIFSGVQLFALGIIGEYLARMHFRLMEKPSYAIREETGHS